MSVTVIHPYGVEIVKDAVSWMDPTATMSGDGSLVLLDKDNKLVAQFAQGSWVGVKKTG